MESKLSNDKQIEKRFALLIDADNVSAKYVAVILDELSKYGTVTYKRIYGDWTTTLHSKWKDTLLENSITPIQQFSYTQGKNATDHAMIIDAMDILYTGQVDGFCIASSDSDFTRLAARIRESGLTVIGMGEKKTPLAFRKACDIFTTLEILLDEVPTKRGRKHTGHAPEGPAPSIAIERIEEAVCAIVTYNLNNGKATGLGEIGSRLQKRYPDFDVRSYGTNQLRKLLEGFESVMVTQEGNSISVELSDDNAAQSAQEEAFADEAFRGKTLNDSASPSRREEDIAVQNETEAQATSASVTQESASDLPVDSDAPADAPKMKRTRRGGRRRKSTTVVLSSSDNEASEALEASKPEAASLHPSIDSERTNPAEAKASTFVSRENVEAYMVNLLADAGDAGISLQTLGKRVRSKFRDFRLHDMGYAKFKDLLADIGQIKLEQRDKATYALLSESSEQQ